MFKRLNLLFLIVLVVLMATACSSKKPLGPDGRPLSEAELAGDYEGRFGEGEIPTAEGESVFRDVRFGYDSDSLDEFALQDIEYNIQVLENYPNLKIQLEGHCDERGTAEYNLALGSKRSKSVYDAMASLGFDAERLSTVSYGEEVPLETGMNESAWSKNRRVHFAGF